MTPKIYYQRLIDSDQILKDEQQAAVIEQLEMIYNQFVKPTSFFRDKFKRKSRVRGLYLWGEVGIGKTFLIDCFFYCLPFKNKTRIHFHSFMKLIHERLNAYQGEKKPLEKIAKELAKETCIICLDELIVNDIADAMLLANLFDALYKENISLLFTSNTPPDNLYWKGLQRESFLPAIELIKKNCDITHITSEKDYRLRNYDDNNFYYTPLGEEAEKKLRFQFETISQGTPESKLPLHLYGRDVPVRKVAGDIVWFDFLDICGIPRCQDDYLAIAKQYQTIIISNVMAIQPEQNDLARSFINLVDVFYDAKKRLIISAEKPLEELYRSGRMLFEFARTRSRLIEMQTLEWQKNISSNK